MKINKGNAGGFSLVEVVMAMGVVSLVLVPVLGLLACGLHTFGDSVDSVTISNIAQQVFASNQESGTQAASSTNYFDFQGNQLIKAPTATTPPANTLYWAMSVATPQTSLPGAPSPNTYLITVKVVVARNPNGVAIPNWNNPPSGVSFHYYASQIAQSN